MFLKNLHAQTHLMQRVGTERRRKLQRGANEVAFHQELVAQLAAAERRLDLYMQCKRPST